MRPKPGLSDRQEDACDTAVQTCYNLRAAADSGTTGKVISSHTDVEGCAMSRIRIRAKAEADGELHLHGLPIHKGQEAEVIVLTEESADKALLSILENDPSWPWLGDPDEDVYTDEDGR